MTNVAPRCQSAISRFQTSTAMAGQITRTRLALAQLDRFDEGAGFADAHVEAEIGRHALGEPHRAVVLVGESMFMVVLTAASGEGPGHSRFSS